MSKIWKTGPTKAFKIIKPIVHVGFVPLIIYIAIKQEPQLTLWQILFPLASPADPVQLQ
uniref:Mitochondrial import receptor subunit TOM7 n=1 Tax=Globisporangium ultimum (strain ATCC 200006 / CBS 805.95 / DAOM BR144) TaxID=431595 RepID=K3X4I6_GLOUD